MSNWRKYVDAARRKLAIAAYHRDCLRRELTSPDLMGSELPPIAVQAHFEGVIVSVMAAVDQVAQATNSALGLRLPQGEILTKAFERLGQSIPDVGGWFSERIGRDVRIIRVRTVHYSYAKDPAEHRWRVESVGRERDYGGSRELLSYVSAAVEYGERLRTLLGCIEDELARQCGTTSVR